MSIDDFMLNRGHPYMTIAERDAAIAEWNTSGQACKRCHGDGFAECRCVTFGGVMPDPVPRPTICPGPVTCDHGAANWRPEPTQPRCAAVDSFGRTFKGATCPVHGGSRCPVDLEEREPARLHPADLEAIARRVAELLRGAP